MPSPDRDETMTPAMLRAKIDSGQTGEKVDFPDPSAAPLGTDDEAGHSGPVRIAKPGRTDAAKPARATPSFPYLWVLILAGVAVIVVSAWVVYSRG